MHSAVTHLCRCSVPSVAFCCLCRCVLSFCLCTSLSPNILLDSSRRAKICDFGLSRTKAQSTALSGQAGTYQWMAPEVIAGGDYTEAADVYSFGIVSFFDSALFGKHARFGCVRRGAMRGRSALWLTAFSLAVSGCPRVCPSRPDPLGDRLPGDSLQGYERRPGLRGRVDARVASPDARRCTRGLRCIGPCMLGCGG